MKTVLCRVLSFIAGGLAITLPAVVTMAQDSSVPATTPLEEQQIETDGLHARFNRIETFLNSIDTLRANFTQIAQDGTLSHGVLSLDRPGRMRFEFTDDTPLLLVSDGTVLNFIDYDVGQVTRWPIKETPLGILVADQVDLQAADAMISRLDVGGRSVFLVSASDPDKPEQGNLTLLIEELPDNTLSLKGWEVMDGQGRVTRIRLDEVHINNATMDKALWTFDDPRKLPSQRRRRAR